MSKKRRQKDFTSRYLRGALDEDTVEQGQRFSDKNKHFQQRKTEKTGLLRAAQEEQTGDIESLPIGQVIQVYSRFCDVKYEGNTYLCIKRKTMSSLSETDLVVGDLVHFRDMGTIDPQGRHEAMIEQVRPRKTVLTRTESFKGDEQHPIVANAEQMLIVASLVQPRVKWGLIDRMVIAARGGGLLPILCLNKVDLADEAETTAPLAELLRDKLTVLAGHSGVGKSSLIRVVEPTFTIRIGEISTYTEKGRHTTSSAKLYRLTMGGAVIDTPGVKLFGLWGVTQENLDEYFPDVVAGTAPQWRKESYERIRESVAWASSP
jgi:ribosome biogenesis GTPase